MPTTPDVELRENVRALRQDVDDLKRWRAESERESVADLKAALQREQGTNQSRGWYVITAIVTLVTGAFLLFLGRLISQAVK